MLYLQHFYGSGGMPAVLREVHPFPIERQSRCNDNVT